jgi:hypothetical protein
MSHSISTLMIVISLDAKFIAVFEPSLVCIRFCPKSHV